METLTAQQVIDDALIRAALQYYQKDVAPAANDKIMSDLSRLINEYGAIAKTPLTYNDEGALVVAPADSGKEQRIVTIDKL